MPPFSKIDHLNHGNVQCSPSQITALYDIFQLFHIMILHALSYLHNRCFLYKYTSNIERMTWLAQWQWMKPKGYLWNELCFRATERKSSNVRNSRDTYVVAIKSFVAKT